MTVTTMVRSVAPRNRLQAAFLSAIVVGSLTAGVSYASIPDSGGVIHGCYSKSGALKIIDTAQKATCPKATTSLNWSQSSSDTGPSGLQNFSSSGTWVAPPGVTGVHVLAVGGDGGGGPTIPCNNSLTHPYEGQAGGAGGYVDTVMAVTPGDHYAVTVGAGGGPDPMDYGGGNGSPGSDTEIADPTTTVLVRAGGGAGGALSAVVTCDLGDPSPATAGVAYSASGGLELPGGACKALALRVDPCGAGGAAAYWLANAPENGAAGDGGQVVLEW